MGLLGFMSLVYRFAFVKSLRMVLRMKVLQVGGGLGVVLPATQLLVPSSDALGAGTLAGLGVGVVAVASSCSWYCERLVQELRLLGGGRLRVSTLTMWGHRRDRDYSLKEVEPTYPSSGPEADDAGRTFVPLHLPDHTFMLIHHPLNVRPPFARPPPPPEQAPRCSPCFLGA